MKDTEKTFQTNRIIEGRQIMVKSVFEKMSFLRSHKGHFL